jgi:hypothetical protein
MLAAALHRKCRYPCGTEPAHVAARLMFKRAIPTSSVKRSVLAMSMRFSYDATTSGSCLNHTMTAPLICPPNPCHSRQEPGATTCGST